MTLYPLSPVLIPPKRNNSSSCAPTQIRDTGISGAKIATLELNVYPPHFPLKHFSYTTLKILSIKICLLIKNSYTTLKSLALLPFW